MAALELHLHPADAEALLRVVDPDGEFNGSPENEVLVVADDTVEVAHVVLVGDTPAAGAHPLRSLDPVTYAIIALSHNAADDFEAVKALGEPGVFEGERGQAALAQYRSFVGLPREEIISLAYGFGQQLQMAAMVQALAEELGGAVGQDNVIDVIEADGSDHFHPNTLDEHGGEA